MKSARRANQSYAGSRPRHGAKRQTEPKSSASSRQAPTWQASAQDLVQDTRPLLGAPILACSLLESVKTFSSLERKLHDTRRRSLAPEIGTTAARLRSPQISFRPDCRRDRWSLPPPPA